MTSPLSYESFQDIAWAQEEGMQQMAGGMTLSVYQKISRII